MYSEYIVSSRKKNLFPECVLLLFLCIMTFSTFVCADQSDRADGMNGFSPDGSSVSTELTGLLGKDINEAASLYGLDNYYDQNALCSDFTVYYNPVAAVEVVDNDHYTLSGIHPLMDIETARKILADAGYEPTRTEDVFVLKQENYYIDLNGMKLENKSVILFHMELPDPGDRTDLAIYLGKPIREVQNALPGLEYEETYVNQEIDDTMQAHYYNDDVSFTATENSQGEYVVSSIRISDNGNAYCIDGFSPSPQPFSGIPAVFILGSGEWYDPLHGVLFNDPSREDESGNIEPGYIFINDYSIYPLPEDEDFEDSDEYYEDDDEYYDDEYYDDGGGYYDESDSYTDEDLFSYSDECVSFEVPEGENNIELQNSEYGLAYVVRFADHDGDIGYRQSRAKVVRIDRDLLYGVGEQGINYPGYESLFFTTLDFTQDGIPEDVNIYEVDCINKGEEYEFIVYYHIQGDFVYTDRYRFIGFDPETGFCMQVYSRCFFPEEYYLDNGFEYSESLDQFKAFYRTFRLRTSISNYDMQQSIAIPRLLHANYRYSTDEEAQEHCLHAARVGNAFLNNELSMEDAVLELEYIQSVFPDDGTEVSLTISLLIEFIRTSQVESIKIVIENLIVMESLDRSEVFEYDWSAHEHEINADSGGYNRPPADLSDAEADWRAVNEAGLVAGEPVSVPGDFYTDGQERYKETGYILPQSATQYLTEDDIAHLTMKGCCYARNEIYARHGRGFNAAELKEYFNSRSWYVNSVSPDAFDEEYTRSVFNEYEYANAYFLLEYEESRGMYFPQ